MKMKKTIKKEDKQVTNEVVSNEQVSNEVVSNKQVSNEQLYEGLICLDVKLTKLVEIMDKLYSIAEMKQTGGRNTLNR